MTEFLGIIVIIQIALAAVVSSSISPSTLQLVHLLYRHGDRSPLDTFPTNHVPASVWPQGFGYLTTIGIQQHFLLGRFMRQYYYGFLNESFKPDEISVRSTDIDRTLMSAESHLAGLYPPTGEQVWNSSIKWQPIPIHTVPLSMDHLLSVKAHCPHADQIVKDILESDSTRKTLRKYKGLLDYLSLKTGMVVDSSSDVRHLYDTLVVQEAHNYTSPEWLSNKTMQELEYLTEWDRSLWLANDKVVRLRGGPLLADVTKNMVNKSENLLPKNKMFMYSTHDSTMIAFLYAARVYNDLLPPYAAAVMLELHKDPNGTYSVMVLYKNSSADPYVLTVPGCTEQCSLPRFISLTKRFAVTNWEEECGLTNINSSLKSENVKLRIATAVLGSVLILVLIVTATFILISYKFKRRIGSERIQ